MESNYYSMKREDNQLIVITHLCQLLTCFTGVGGFIVPLILWLTQKDKVIDMDLHGKAIVNFQLSIILYALICVPLIFLLGLGLLGLLLLAFLSFIFPIINAIRASNRELPNYPLSLNFVS
jgi:hypothetical protein